MKRTAARSLSLLLLLLMLWALPLPALAKQLTILSPKADSDALFEDGSTQLAALAANDLGVFAYLQGQADSLLYLPKGEEKPLMLSARTVPESLEEGDALPPYPGPILAGDGTHLYGIQTDTGTLYEILLHEDDYELQPVTALQDVSSLVTPLDDTFSMPLPQLAAFVQDGRFYFLGERYTEGNVLTALDMATGKATVPDVANLQFAAPYKDGTILLVTAAPDTVLDENGVFKRVYDFLIFHPDTNTTEPWSTVHSPDFQGVTYVPETDMVVVATGGRLYQIAPGDAIRQVGSYPPINGNLVQLTPCGTQVLLGSSSYLGLRDVSTAFDPTAVLHVSGYSRPQTDIHFETDQGMGVTHSDTYWDADTGLSRDLLAQGGADVFTVSTEYYPTEALIRKGYYTDLSGDETLMAYVKSLHPLFQQEVLHDGRLVGIPIAATHYRLQMDSQVMNTMGLTPKAMPVSVLSLMAFISKWNDTWAEDFPELSPMLTVTDIRKTVFQFLLSIYVHTMEQQGKPLRFDTEDFRKVMAGFEAMETDNLPRVNDQQIIYYGTFLYEDAKDSIFSTHYTQSFSEVMMPLTKNYPPVYPIDLEIMMVNPNSAHKEAAMNYLKAAIATQDRDHRYALIAGMDKPLVNPNYETSKAEITAWLADMESTLKDLQQGKAHAADTAGLEDAIQSLQDTLAQLEKEKYLITQEQIDAYRAVLSNGAMVVHVSLEKLFPDGMTQHTPLIDNYLAGMVTLEDFIQQMDRMLMMAEKES